MNTRLIHQPTEGVPKKRHEMHGVTLMKEAKTILPPFLHAKEAGQYILRSTII